MADINNVLVTGGSGRLGSYVVDCLREVYDVTVFDRSPPKDSVPHIVGDILDPKAVSEAVAGKDAIVHLAALDADATASDSEFFEVNVMGTWNTFECAHAANVKKIVHCSSVAALNISRENPPRYLPIDIEHHADPEIAYGVSKLVGEKIARRFAMLGEMDIICLRPTLILSPPYVYDTVKLTAEADGTTLPPDQTNPAWKSYGEVIPGSRAFVDPRDVATAFKAALQADDISWGVYFVASEDTYSGLETMEVIRREFGIEPELRDPDRFARNPNASIYDIAETTRALGWQPAYRWADVYREVLGIPWESP